MLEVKIYENYEEAEKRLSGVAKANQKRVKQINQEMESGKEDFSLYTIRPLIELRTDGEKYWFWDKSGNLDDKFDDDKEKEEHTGESVLDLAFSVVKFLRSLKRTVPGIMIMPTIYSVAESSYGSLITQDSSEEQEAPEKQFDGRDTADILNLSVDGPEDNLQKVLDRYAKTLENQKVQSRGLSIPDCREFVIYSRQAMPEKRF